MEGPRLEQSEPILQREPLHGPVGADHQPARAMNFDLREPVRGHLLNQHRKRDVSPDGRRTAPEIQSQSTADGERTFCRLHGMYLKRAGGWSSTFGQEDCLEFRLSAFATEMRWRDKKACVLFNVSRTVYRRIISCICLVKPR